MRLLVFSILLFFSGAMESSAEDYTPECIEGLRLAVFQDQYYINFENIEKYDSNLPTRSFDQTHVTSAAVHMTFAGENENFWNKTFFDLVLPPGQTLGLPYTVYGFQIKVGEESEKDQYVFFHDFTKNCSPGQSFFPGGKLIIPDIAIPKHQDGSPRLQEKIDIKIWGQRT